MTKSNPKSDTKRPEFNVENVHKLIHVYVDVAREMGVTFPEMFAALKSLTECCAQALMKSSVRAMDKYVDDVKDAAQHAVGNNKFKIVK